MLRSIVTETVYQDDPFFSDQLLLPAIATGQSVSLVTSFAPSYLMRLVGDLASSPEIEPGKLSVVFCVPFSLGPGLSKSRLLSLFLSAYATRAQDVKSALEAMLQLAQEGGLRLGALFSSDSKLLTPGCIGVLESGETGSNDFLGFIDVSAGDHNSPIAISTSWGADPGPLDNIARVVMEANGKEYDHLERVTHSDVLAMLKDILRHGYPKQDIKNRDRKSTPGKSQKPVKTPVRTRKSKDDDGPTDWEIFALEDELGFDDIEFELLSITEPNISNRNSEYLYDFLGDPELGEEVAYLNLSEVTRGHVGPLPLVVASLVGNGVAECWCGEVFDRLSGCPDYYA